MKRFLCFIIGHSYGYFDINWFKEDFVNITCRCSRCDKKLGAINHKRPRNWDEIPF